MVNNLKVVKRCNGNAFADGCIPDYKGIDTMHKANNEGVSDIDTNKATTGCGGYRENNIKTKSIALVLADGSIYITYGADDWYKFPLFLIDVTGKKAVYIQNRCLWIKYKNTVGLIITGCKKIAPCNSSRL